MSNANIPIEYLRGKTCQGRSRDIQTADMNVLLPVKHSKKECAQPTGAPLFKQDLGFFLVVSISIILLRPTLCS